MESKTSITKTVAISVGSTVLGVLIVGVISFYISTIKEDVIQNTEIANLKAQLENLRVAYGEDIGDLNDKIYELKK
mgnify:CR=1 FL=1